MKAKQKSANKTEVAKIEPKRSHKKSVNSAEVEPEIIVKQLNRDVRDAVLVVSLFINAYVLIGWLVLQVTHRFDASLIGYLQNR